MKWFKISHNTWVSEREAETTLGKSRIKEHEGVFYACGENNNVLVQKQFNNLKDAKKWVRDETGWFH